MATKTVNVCDKCGKDVDVGAKDFVRIRNQHSIERDLCGECATNTTVAEALATPDKQ